MKERGEPALGKRTAIQNQPSQQLKTRTSGLFGCNGFNIGGPPSPVLPNGPPVQTPGMLRSGFHFCVSACHCILLDRTYRDLPQRARIPGEVGRIVGSPARSALWLPKTLLIQIARSTRPPAGTLPPEAGLHK